MNGRREVERFELTAEEYAENDRIDRERVDSFSMDAANTPLPTVGPEPTLNPFDWWTSRGLNEQNRSIIGKAYGGLTGGFDFGQALPDVPGPLDDIAEMGGMMASAGALTAAGGWLAGGTRLAAALPRVTKLLETIGTGVYQEASISGSRDGTAEEILEDAWFNGLLGAAPEGIARGAGYLREGIAGTKHNVFSKQILERLGLMKQGLDPERAALDMIMRNYGDEGVGAPSLTRPRDWLTNLTETRASRSVSGRPWMQRAHDRMQTALKSFADDTVDMVGPGSVVNGYMVENSDVGKLLQDAFTKHLNHQRRAAQTLYDKVFDGPMAHREVTTDVLVEDLEQLLRHWNYDPKAALQPPGVGAIQSFVDDLKKGAESYQVLGPDGQIAQEGMNLLPKELGWINARLRQLSIGDKKKWTADDLIKQDAASVIRENVHDALGEISPEHAQMVDKARELWGSYRRMQRHSLAKPLLTKDPNKIISALFDSKATVNAAREVLSDEMYQLARQRWIANILYKGSKPKADMQVLIGTEYVLDSASLNKAFSDVGGIENETLRAAFSDAPEQLEALHRLRSIIQQATPTLRRYRGEAEMPGGPESQGVEKIVRGLFSSIAFPSHLVSTSRLGRSLTSPPALNPFLGGVSGPGPLDNSLSRGIASGGLRDLVR